MTSNSILALFSGALALVNPEQQARFDVCAEQAHAFLMSNADKLAEAAHTAQADDGFWPEPGHWLNYYRPYKVVNGTLQIPVKGILLHNFPYALSDWATGYEYIARALQRGLADGTVQRIALIVDSPGGMVAGCAECGEKIFEARSVKPIEGFAHESAYSAAYWLISATGKITVSRTGGVGSIGVVTSHTDISERMKQLGARITFIFAGKHKVDGNAYEPLPDDVKARIQVRIDELYGVFVSTVARHRDLEESAIRETEAQCFTATEAKSNGLADAIGPLDDALASFEADLSPETENETMSTQDNSAATDAAAATAALDAARAEGIAAGRTEGATAERGRITAIEACDEAKNRPAAARNVAMNTDMTIEQAKAFLAGMPEETTAAAQPAGAGAGADRFDTAMASGNPDLTGNGEDGNDDEDATAGSTGANALLAARKQVTGFGHAAKSGS